MQQIVDDMNYSIKERSHAVLSGEKGALSPFDKKLANFQKSAEMRRGAMERSGSHKRQPMYPPSYQSNKQIPGLESDLKPKLRQLGFAVEDLYAKCQQRAQEFDDLDRFTEHTLLNAQKSSKAMLEQQQKPKVTPKLTDPHKV